MAKYNIVQNNTLWYNTIISQYDIIQIKMNQSQVYLDLSNRPENDTNKHADTKRRILNSVGIAFCGFS